MLEPERLAAVARARTAVSQRDHGLHGIARLAADTFAVSFGFLSFVDHAVQRFVAVGGPDAAALPSSLPVDASVSRHLVAAEAPLLVPDLADHPVLRDLGEVRALGLRSYAGIPVRSRDGHVVGGLCVAHRDVRAWSAADVALLQGLAEAASHELRLLVSVQELQLAQARERRRAQERAVLHRVAVAVARGETPDLVLQRVAEELVQLGGAVAAVVLRVDGPADTTAVAAAGTRRPYGAPAGSHDVREVLDGLPDGVLEEVRDAVRAGRPAALPTASGRTCLVAPVLVEGRGWGAVVVDPAQAPDEDAAGRLAHLAELAELIGLVVVNVETTRLLQEAARTDPLTGAANRRAFEEQLATELARTRRHGKPLLLALVDVDHFKRINDRYGHDVGDRVLVELSDRVHAQLRSVDLLARVGGDEWALLLPGTDRHEGAAVLERVRASVAATPLGGTQVTVTIGAAVAGAVSEAGALYRSADRALYSAKSQGRDRLALADQTGVDALRGTSGPTPGPPAPGSG